MKKTRSKKSRDTVPLIKGSPNAVYHEWWTCPLRPPLSGLYLENMEKPLPAATRVMDLPFKASTQAGFDRQVSEIPQIKSYFDIAESYLTFL